MRRMICVETHKKAVFVEIDEEEIIYFNKRSIKLVQFENAMKDEVPYESWKVLDTETGECLAMLYYITNGYFASKNETITDGENIVAAAVRLLVEDWDYGVVFI